MNKLCARCGKPVYFAERKTSLGREWHPNCLKCNECGRILAPGQHAEHKSLPYCHHPCYRVLFGPAIVGFGSNNISIPKSRPYSCNLDYYAPQAYAKDITNSYHNHIQQNSITTTARTTATAITTTTTTSATSTVCSTKTSADTLKSPLEPVIETTENTKKTVAAAVDISQVIENHIPPPTRLLPQDLLDKVDTFNRYHQSKIHNQMTVEQEEDGSVHIKGPLRIYWGLSRPIQLSHCDDKPAAPVSKWRHSLHVGNKLPDIPERKFNNTMSLRRPLSPSNKSREMDDIILSSSTDDVVRRKKKGVPKFKTVAYRGDEPTKWKRASINGHVFNYDTSVFTPVLGSCTSVVINDKMDSMYVIKTLLDKFKVQNSTDEYVLSLVNEEGERLLSNSDLPLMERLNIGPHETLGKLFIKERQMEANILPVDTHIQIPIVETAEEQNLPHEVEQLLVLPEAVLRGILVKFKKDEEQDVQLVKARYETARKRILQQLGEISFKTTSTA